MEKEKTFDELARDIVRKQDDENAIVSADVETVTKQGHTRIVRGAATEEEKREVRDMYRKGIGVCEIARRTGFAQSTISRWVGTWQIDPTKSVKHKRKKNEPAPAPTGTSPQTNNLHLDDNTSEHICQAFIQAQSAAVHILEIYEGMSEAEQRAFDLGEVYNEMCGAIEELEDIKGGEAK